VLDASLSIPKQREAPNNKSKGAATGGNRQKEEKKKTKKPMYSLRTLTPLNPPSAPPQTAQGNPQSKGWDNAAPAQVSPREVSNNSQPSADKGYVHNQGKGSNNNNNSGKQSRNKNNNINRSRGKQNFKAVPEIVDDVPTEAVPDSYAAPPEIVNEVPTTEVHITIEECQIWWTLKLTNDQLQDFYKAVEPFGCYLDSQ